MTVREMIQIMETFDQDALVEVPRHECPGGCGMPCCSDSVGRPQFHVFEPEDARTHGRKTYVIHPGTHYQRCGNRAPDIIKRET